MATVEQIVREIQDELTDHSFPVYRILELMNEGAEELAYGQYPHYNLPEICLPALETFGSLATSASDHKVLLSGLTAPFCKKLISCANGSDPKIVVSSPAQIEQYYPGLNDTGTIQYVAASGDYLYYGPKGGETLTLQYFKMPDTLKIGDTPSFLPANLQKKLLKNYVLMMIPAKYRTGLLYNPAELFQVAVMQLFYTYGTYAPKPAHIHNLVGEYYEYVC